jgi:proline iminopeptidase
MSEVRDGGDTTLFLSAANATGGCSSAYFDSADRDDVLSGGVKMIPIDTPTGTFKVWTKRVGNNPTTKVLVLHGGHGATHEYFEAFDT